MTPRRNNSDALTLGMIFVVALAIIGLSVFIGTRLAPRSEATVIREVVTATRVLGQTTLWPTRTRVPTRVPTATRVLGGGLLATRTPVSVRGSGILVTRSEYGDAWPLTVSEARLECRGNDLIAVINGASYALNGTAQARHAPINPYWRDNPSVPGLKVVITPLIERARDACL